MGLDGSMAERVPGALVTGSSRGLGRGVALELARAGFSVAVHCAANRAAAEETARLCVARARDGAQRFPIVEGDLGEAEGPGRIWAAAVAALGAVDALVNNAGIAPRVRADITEAGMESFDEVLRVNLRGPYFLAQAAARWWLAHPGGSAIGGGYKLVFVTSISADTASVMRGEYCVSKAGLAMACRLWAARLAGSGAQVYEVRPGIMETDMTAGVKEKYDRLIGEGLVPQGRWGTPEDVGRAVRGILAGDLAFSTGSVIHVDGGFHISRL